MTQTQARDVTRALPAWANPRWRRDTPAAWAADAMSMVRIEQMPDGGLAVFVPGDGGMVRADATWADVILAWAVASGWRP